MTRTREQPGGDFLDFVLACINAIGDISKQEAGDAIEREWKLRTAPLPLTDVQEQAIKAWAADDRLWTTQETVEFNLRTFARHVLAQK